MRKFFVILLAMIMLLPYTVKAADFAKLQGVTYAKVVEVVDGEAFIAALIPNGQPIMVRMLGVKSEGNDIAIKYANNTLLGSLVRLETDPQYRAQVNRWNLAYVYKNNVLINSEMLTTGSAKLNTAHSDASMYSTLQRAESRAISNKIGVWAEPEQFEDSYSGRGININTATASQLVSRLNISNSLANRIISYREDNPFKTVSEIKFVTGFSKKLFDDNRYQMIVCTNINLASENELITLAGLTDTDVERLIEYRGSGRLTDITRLYTDSIITRSKYEKNRPFISATTVPAITATVPEETAVNINTAAASQLRRAGFSQTQADLIVQNRENYSYKTIEELSKIFTFSKSSVDSIAGNLTIYTDINTAEVYELRSLLGESGSESLATRIQDARPIKDLAVLKDIISTDIYERILPYIYINAPEPDYTNINTASREELIALGLTNDEAGTFIENRYTTTNGAEIPDYIIEYDMNISLYTNINKASSKELMSLGSAITSSIANDIIAYRKDQPFGDLDEVYDFFEDKSMLNFYQEIKDFIVLR